MHYLWDSNNYTLDDYADNRCKKNVFKVFGKGIISVKPDTAEIIIGVTTENVQLETAQEENARITAQVINSIIEVGVEPNNIQTSSYNIRPNYDYINGKQVFRGYEVSNNLKIAITHITSAGEIIDTAVRNGANTVSNITFLVSDETKYYYKALTIAVIDAQNKAAVIANKLNVKLNITPIVVSEKSIENIAPLEAMTFKAASVSTPIEGGENRITAEIEALFVYE